MLRTPHARPLHLHSSNVPCDVKDEVDENGFVRTRLVASNRSDLPDTEKFDLDKLIKAGVPLEQTKTKLLGCRDAELVAALESVTEEQKPQLKEQLNKQTKEA